MNSRISPPAAAELYVPRPRIAGRIGESLRASRLVWVTASAGSGKTTAVLKAVEETVGTLAWLTVDSSEAAPGRLLKYLEAALVHACPELPYAATGALDAGSSHTEAAGLLAEALADRPLTLVIDELERLVESSASLALLETFLRYSPPTLSVVLISRRQIQLRLGSALGIGAGPIGERELAFTVAEAAQALERLGRPPADASSAVEATGGWVAGVLFEAWRSDRHVHGAGGEADPLHGYLATEIMEQLSPRARQFLIVTSVLDDVTAVRATALGQVEADDVMAELRSHHLPITYAADGTVLRCHPRFREYLEACLKLGDSTRLTSVRQAYGQLLVRERRCEEAVDQLLLAGDMEAAVAAAERALPEVLSRLDLTVADHWLSAFETDAIETSSTLTYAELLVALEREEWRTGAQCADRLRGLLAERSSTPMKAGLAAAIAWCYNLMNRIDDARSVIESAECAPETEAMRFAIDVDLDGSGVHYRDRPSNCGGTTDGLLARIDFGHGRFTRLLEPSKRPWAAAYTSRIAALRCLGRLEEALDLIQDVERSNDWTTNRIHAELLADLDRPDDARAVLASARERLDRGGSPVFRMFHLLIEASLALRFDRDTAVAAAALRRVEADPTAHLRIRVKEQLALFWGLAALIDGDSATAASHLREAVANMVRYDRNLFLPMAAVYLAEAEWRLDEPEAADAAADLALEAARRQGSNHLLLRALRDFPSVVAWRLDAESEPDSAWHEMGRALMAGDAWAGAVLSPRVRVLEFGEPVIIADARAVPVKLIKSFEVLAYLAANGREAPRTALLEALFEGRNDHSSRSYLRQALTGLERALPSDAPLVIETDYIRWIGPTLTSESVELEQAVMLGTELGPRDRLKACTEALSKLESGEYLAGARSEWVDDRRNCLSQLATEARHSAARAAFELGDAVTALGFVERVLDEEPYRESAWRLAMRIAGLMGDHDRVIAIYRRCERALREVNAEPAESTRSVLQLTRR